MDFNHLLISAEEGFKEWINKEAKANLSRHFKVERGIQNTINKNSKDKINTMTPVLVINAIYRALNAKGEKFIRDKKQNTYLVRDCVITPGLSLGGHHTVQGAAFVILCKMNPLRRNGFDIREIIYFTESGEKRLNRSQIEDLINKDPKTIGSSLDSFLI